MKVLILHPSDQLTPSMVKGQYDAVVDLGSGASRTTYQDWTQRSGCPVVCLYDFAKNSEDLYLTRTLLRLGKDHLMDRYGIDWWDVLSPQIVPGLQQVLLIQRLAQYLNGEAEIFSSRADYRSAALHAIVGGSLVNLEGSFQAGKRRLQHYSDIAATFSLRDIFQIAQDKFDSKHAIRRRLAKHHPSSPLPTVLLPSAYENVSHMALSYAALLPDEQFLLVCCRPGARMRVLAPNVASVSLDPYFSSPNSKEVSSLSQTWDALKRRLMRSAPEYETASKVGIFARMPAWIEWGITIRDAWRRLLQSANIRSCFSADQNNPYTRIPLLLAKQAGLPAVACHHGALDRSMAMNTHDADFYVAKGRMECDYMTRVCGIAPDKVREIELPRAVPQAMRSSDDDRKSWLVFFSEPYDPCLWRLDEIYRELLPPLCSLAEACGLQLVFKLHPFETARGHRNLLMRLLPADTVRQIEIITGPISEQLWQNARFALTAQSSVALECTARGVPIFLCEWLKDFSGYVEQFARFGIGHLLETPAQISHIPYLLESKPRDAKCDPTNSMPPHALRELLAPSARIPIAAAG